jgi:CheY-like chemotaxis protein
VARIFWLDDSPKAVTEPMQRLHALGHDVTLFPDEQPLIHTLTTQPLPDLLIQDIQRLAAPGQMPGQAPRTGSRQFAGWAFYNEILRQFFPEIPVLIYSYDAFSAKNLARADDFNLMLIPKRSGETELINAVEHRLRSHLAPFRTNIEVPSLVSVDFAKVNHALIKHLSNYPEDLHRVSWGSFEELVEKLLRELGYEVWRTKLTRDEGVDICGVYRNEWVCPSRDVTIHGKTLPVTANRSVVLSGAGLHPHREGSGVVSGNVQSNLQKRSI